MMNFILAMCIFIGGYACRVGEEIINGGKDE